MISDILIARAENGWAIVVSDEESQKLYVAQRHPEAVGMLRTILEEDAEERDEAVQRARQQLNQALKQGDCPKCAVDPRVTRRLEEIRKQHSGSPEPEIKAQVETEAKALIGDQLPVRNTYPLGARR